MTKEKPQKKVQLKLKESDITNQLKDWAYKIHPKDVTLIRNNTTGIPNGRGSLRKNPDSGHPDYHVIYHLAGIPITLFFEVKAPDGRVQAHQKKWHEAFDKRGIRTFIIKSIEDAENALIRIEKEFQTHINFSYLGIPRRNVSEGVKFRELKINKQNFTQGVETGKGTPEKDHTSATRKEAKIMADTKQKAG